MERYIVVATLAGAAMVTLTCPCPKLNNCHIPLFFGLIGTATAIIAFINFV